MNRSTKFLLFIFCICLFCGQLIAQGSQSPAAVADETTKPPGDPRLTRALNQTNTEFQIDPKNGFHTVVYETENKRTQEVVIVPRTEVINGDEMRLIFSFALLSDQPPSQQTANLLLEKNADSIGRWAVHKLSGNRFAVVNQLYVPADLDGAKLELSLMTVAKLADEMEARLSQKDEN